MLQRCLQRVRKWRTPLNWSAGQWMEEAAAQAALACVESRSRYADGVVKSGSSESWISNCLLQRYRQEWSFARHCSRPVVCEPYEPEEVDGDMAPMVPRLQAVLTRLPQPDRQLIHMLYWEHQTETQVAAALGVSQQAISKRKHRIFSRLCAFLKEGYSPLHTGGVPLSRDIGVDAGDSRP